MSRLCLFSHNRVRLFCLGLIQVKIDMRGSAVFCAHRKKARSFRNFLRVLDYDDDDDDDIDKI